MGRGIGGRRPGQVDVGVVEESEAEFQAQHVAHQSVNHRLVEPPLPDQRLHRVGIGVALHVDVDPGGGGQHRGVELVGGHAVVYHLGDGVPVADQHPVESPAVTQHITHEPAVARRGHAVYVVERCHECGHPGSGGGLERRQHHILEQGQGQPGGVVVLSRLAESVAGEMLGACRHRRRVGQVVGLVAAYHRQPHPLVEQRVLPRRLGDAAPARVTRDIHHRGESPADSRGGGLHGGYAGSLLHQLGVPGRRLSQGNREHRVEPVYHVARENQRNAEARLLHRLALQAVDHLWVDLVDYRADPPLGDSRPEGVKPRRVELVELPDFLLQGHPGHQGIYAGLGGGIPSGRRHAAGDTHECGCREGHCFFKRYFHLRKCFLGSRPPSGDPP